MIKFKTIITSVFFVFSLFTVQADDFFILQNRLNKINSFYCTFVQRILDSKNIVLQEGQGELWVKYPNLFKLHMLLPDENWFISNGKTIWFYNPLLKQATAYWLKDVMHNNIPFVIITKNNIFDVNKYNIKKKKDTFIIQSKQNNSNYKTFEIKINSNGITKSLKVIDNHDQSIYYKLENYKINHLYDNKFNFELPLNVLLDDQRK